MDFRGTRFNWRCRWGYCHWELVLIWHSGQSTGQMGFHGYTPTEMKSKIQKIHPESRFYWEVALTGVRLVPNNETKHKTLVFIYTCEYWPQTPKKHPASPLCTYFSVIMWGKGPHPESEVKGPFTASCTWHTSPVFNCLNIELPSCLLWIHFVRWFSLWFISNAFIKTDEEELRRINYYITHKIRKYLEHCFFIWIILKP